MSKPWNKTRKPKRAEIERQLKHLEETSGLELVCFKKGCDKPGIGMDECLTCEQLGRTGSRKFKVVSCEDHRMEGLGMVKKHALVKHPSNLLRVIGAGLMGEEI